MGVKELESRIFSEMALQVWYSSCGPGGVRSLVGLKVVTGYDPTQFQWHGPISRRYARLSLSLSNLYCISAYWT